MTIKISVVSVSIDKNLTMKQKITEYRIGV